MSKHKRERREKNRVDARARALKHKLGSSQPTFNIPSDMNVFRWGEAKTYRLDFIEYIAGEGNPMADPGQRTYERTIFVHKGLGANFARRLCNQKTLNKKCAGCDFVTKNRTKLDRDTLVALLPKEQQGFLVIDQDDRKKGVQFLQESFNKWFGQMLDHELGKFKEKDPRKYFYDLEEGFTVEVEVIEDKGDRGKFMKPYKINIVPREEQYEITKVNEKKRLIEFSLGKKTFIAPCLDDMIEEQDYKELRKLIMDVPEEDEDEDEDTDDDENEEDEEENEEDDSEEEDEDEDNEEDDEEEEDKPKVKKGKKGKKKKEEDEDSDEDSDSDDAEEEETDEEDSDDNDEEEDSDDDDESDEEKDEDEEEKPKKKKGKVKKKSKKSDDEDEDDEDLPF